MSVHPDDTFDAGPEDPKNEALSECLILRPDDILTIQYFLGVFPRLVAYP